MYIPDYTQIKSEQQSDGPARAPMRSDQCLCCSLPRNKFNLHEQSLHVKPKFKTANRNTSSRKHLCTKVTPDFHLTYSKNGGNLGSESK